MKRNIIIACIAVSAVAMNYSTGFAKVVLPSFVTDSMVVQQNDVLTLVGKANGAVEVKASWSNESYKGNADSNGAFTISVPTPAAGGPYEIVVADSDSRTTLHDVYSGEVWVCSGQSNMEMPVGGWGKVMNYEQEIASADYPMVRLLQIKKVTAFSPQNDTEINMGGWRTATPSTVENFSSIAYFYAREMSAKLGVHVGVIDCSWGGTPAEAWTSFDGVKTVPGFENEITLLEECDFDAARMSAGYEARMTRWLNSINEVNIDEARGVYHDDWKKMTLPCEWEKSELPDFDGIVWLQQKVVIPEDWAGKPLTLRLGMIDDEDITYFNGVKIATGSGYNVQREYTVPAELVKAGESVISIRVTDFGGGGGLWGAPADVSIAVGNGESISLAGDWKYYVAADFSKAEAKPVSVSGSSFPTVLYNAMLHPLNVLPIKGVLWYQGCANVGRDAQYSVLFRRMINDWRQLWNRPELPFYFVQLAAYLTPREIQPNSQWAALRQAQADALQLPYTAMVSAIDVGDPNDIHPKNKQEVAHRLAVSALKHTYGKKEMVAEAPTVKSWNAKGNVATLRFDGVVVVPAGESPKGFIVKSSDGTWSRPEVKLVKGNEVKIISTSAIEEIKYNWADYPDGNLRGKSGLPVTPFAL